MKKLLFVLGFIVSVTTAGFSQESNLYTFFVNVVSEQFRFPLIGLVNIAKGNHGITQLGLVNWNTKDFNGFQASLINTTGGNFSGAQWGLINTTLDNFYGMQWGLINTSLGDVNGWQGGLVNIASTFHGAQMGLVNTTKTLKGLQLGLINYVDTIESGAPIGLISIVRNGGYHAVEYSFSEFFPVTIGFKIGIEKFYSTIFAAYNPSDGIDISDFALGIGFGSILAVNESFFLNPELNYLSPVTWDKEDQDISSFILYFGYNINKNFSITAGPSVTWINGDNGNLQEPLFKILNHEIDENNSIVVGARASVRFRF